MLKINKQSVDGLFPNKKEGYFELKSEYCPSGDQKQAISELINGINKKEKKSGATGCHWIWKNIYYGKCNTIFSKTCINYGTQ